jgi:hypothetical protein
LKGGQLVLEVGELAAEGVDFAFKAREAVEFGRVYCSFGSGGVSGVCRRERWRGRLTDVAGEKVGVAGFFGAGVSREEDDKRRLALHQQSQGGVDGGEVVELVEALGAGAEFAGSLRAAEKENAEERDFVAVEVEGFREAMLVLGDAAVGGGGARQAVLVKGVERVANGVFVEGHDGFAIGFLVASVEDGVERERVIFRSGDFFFDERAEDASFGGSELEVHGEIHKDVAKETASRL